VKVESPGGVTGVSPFEPDALVIDASVAYGIISELPQDVFNDMMGKVMRAPSPTLLMKRMTSGSIPRGFEVYFTEAIPVPPLIEVATATADNPVSRGIYRLTDSDVGEITKHWVERPHTCDQVVSNMILKNAAQSFKDAAQHLRCTRRSSGHGFLAHHLYRPRGASADHVPGSNAKLGGGIGPVVPYFCVHFNGAPATAAMASPSDVIVSRDSGVAINVASHAQISRAVLLPDGVHHGTIGPGHTTIRLGGARAVHLDEPSPVPLPTAPDLRGLAARTLSKHLSSHDLSDDQWVALFNPPPSAARRGGAYRLDNALLYSLEKG